MSIKFTQLAEYIPVSWSLVPVNGHKQPVDPDTGGGLQQWQKSSFDFIDFPATSPYVKAVGVLTGPASGGLLVVDIDSAAGQELLQSMTGRQLEEFPRTIACTSGKPSTHKRFYQVSDESLWCKLRTIKQKGLDILWKGCQAVLCGEHPETGSYQWLAGCSPMECELQEAPDWLVSSLINFKAQGRPHGGGSFKHSVLTSKQPRRQMPCVANSQADTQSIVLARQGLARWNPASHESYHSWLSVGMMLHSASPSLLEDWIQWSSLMSNFDEDECRQKWNTFTDCHSYYEKTGRPGLGLGTLLSMGSSGPSSATNKELIDAIHNKRTCNTALL